MKSSLRGALLREWLSVLEQRPTIYGIRRTGLWSQLFSEVTNELSTHRPFPGPSFQSSQSSSFPQTILLSGVNERKFKPPDT